MDVVRKAAAEAGVSLTVPDFSRLSMEPLRLAELQAQQALLPHVLVCRVPQPANGASGRIPASECGTGHRGDWGAAFARMGRFGRGGALGHCLSAVAGAFRGGGAPPPVHRGWRAQPAGCPARSWTPCARFWEPMRKRAGVAARLRRQARRRPRWGKRACGRLRNCPTCRCATAREPLCAPADAQARGGLAPARASRPARRVRRRRCWRTRTTRKCWKPCCRMATPSLPLRPTTPVLLSADKLARAIRWTAQDLLGCSACCETPRRAQRAGSRRACPRACRGTTGVVVSFGSLYAVCGTEKGGRGELNPKCGPVNKTLKRALIEWPRYCTGAHSF